MKPNETKDLPQKEEITLTPNQQKALDLLKLFMNDSSARVFILKGYAGTGKTTLVRMFIKELEKRRSDSHCWLRLDEPPRYSLISQNTKPVLFIARFTDTPICHKIWSSWPSNRNSK